MELATVSNNIAVQDFAFINKALCFFAGHSWGTATGSVVGIGHYHCERCGHTETVDNTENYLNAMNQAYAQSGLSAPVFTSEFKRTV